ncbi:Golgi-associated plant pathogenesis-related protein 1-like [Oryzias latipes]|uniref:SCP domain-containing protein n=1 Tax=Oryzias latipes TaxID=8090 RepID=A0A3B3HN61_ORYLA|nr:Golgi-associated plant pathogenesis-related protein 1-like [Oryzias latipes]XP_011477890.1 Golgi-associated plant pathogenesis-related protein 1-like [Oryzias latipes]
MADRKFQQEFLETHNAYRALHGAPPLTYNSKMCGEAQKWADECLRIHTLGHSETKDGENVFFKSGSPSVSITGKDAVDAWYSEIKDYNFKKPGFKSGTGHFTQVVWKESKELGLGMATDGRMAFVVGQYRPPGNFSNPGQFEANVLPKE